MSGGVHPKIAIPIENDFEEAIPPHSVVMATEVTTSDDGQQTRTTVTQFDGSAGNIMVTGPVETPAFLTESGEQVNGRGTAYYDQFLYVAIAGRSTPWAESTAYAVGDFVTNGVTTYECVDAGTSTTGSGPSGTGTGIVDGGVIWDAVQIPQKGDVYGPESGKWFITPLGEGFVAQGGYRVGSNPLRALFYRDNGIQLCHAIVTAPCNPGCNVFEVQLVHRYLVDDCTECDDGSGSGS